MIKLLNVGKSYDQKSNLWAVKDFTLDIETGSFVSFLGPSGCGKTTTLRMIAGLETNTHGVISVNEKIFSDPVKKIFVQPEHRKIGMVFQSYAVWPHMTVFENVAYPLRIQKIPKEQMQKKVSEVLKIVELDSLSERKPHQLSGGQQQRVALARGLAMEPQVLLLDEPLSNLDAKLREKMRKDIREIQRMLKLTVIYVTHDQLEAFTMSDRIVVILHGTIAQVGTPEEIRKSPSSAFVQDFISRN